MYINLNLNLYLYLYLSIYLSLISLCHPFEGVDSLKPEPPSVGCNPWQPIILGAKHWGSEKKGTPNEKNGLSMSIIIFPEIK